MKGNCVQPLTNEYLEHEAQEGVKILEMPDKAARLAAEAAFFKEINGLSREDLMAIRARMNEIVECKPGIHLLEFSDHQKLRRTGGLERA